MTLDITDSRAPASEQLDAIDQEIAKQGQAATGLIGKQITYLDLAGAKQTGVVDSATIDGTTATLKIGNIPVALDKVLSVANAPAS